MDERRTQSKRVSGVLLPVTALPSPYGVGTLGEEAYRFVDLLQSTGVRIWQVLPLQPTGYGDSPYQACASDALNPYWIDLPLLEQEGLLRLDDYAHLDFGSDPRRVDYGKLFENRFVVLRRAFARFDKTSEDWKAFVKDGRYFDFALFMALKEKHRFLPWNKWDKPYQNPASEEVASFQETGKELIAFWQFTQYIFLKQWFALKSYANERGVEIMGDMPIYLSEDSVECWKTPEMFLRDGDVFSPVAGVPPDAFSQDGQLWGNPLYDYEYMAKDGYAWWKNRIDRALALCDWVRIDHFRGFDRFYAIPLGKSAKEGEWLEGPKDAFLQGFSSIVAEDLGLIDERVRELMRKTGFPGMKVACFGFDGRETNEHKPSNYTQNLCVYTGTHDNEPLCGFLQGMSEQERGRVRAEMQKECRKLGVNGLYGTAENECLTVVKLLLASRANMAIVPLHDLLLKGSEARLNFPSKTDGNNWTYRYVKEDFSKEAFAFFKALIERTNR